MPHNRIIECYAHINHLLTTSFPQIQLVAQSVDQCVLGNKAVMFYRLMPVGYSVEQEVYTFLLEIWLPKDVEKFAVFTHTHALEKLDNFWDSPAGQAIGIYIDDIKWMPHKNHLGMNGSVQGRVYISNNKEE